MEVHKMGLSRCLFCFLLSFAISQAQINTIYRGVSDNSIENTPAILNKLGTLSTNSNKKPVFTNCDKYKPFVEEEQPQGTPVIKVHAKMMTLLVQEAQ
ncbi:hypothetical protein NQ317_010445 [Molorchus minor]|uniref:Uncharacterized protein n=1 Tax=Molorchus minor TaxID=1323400 RepID=A0ABQ9JYY8_9CUCU|nr:hypothetical protein NQ317_010445 [Molorchus minor]